MMEVACPESGRSNRNDARIALMMFTLVPFAGTNLSRFRGSRINGLSPNRGHSDKKIFAVVNRKIKKPTQHRRAFGE
jgi:hypothetical protein